MSRARARVYFRSGVFGFLLAILMLFISAMPAGSQTITLAWDPNTEPDLAGYILGYGAVPGADHNLVDVGGDHAVDAQRSGPGRHLLLSHLCVQHSRDLTELPVPAQQIGQQVTFHARMVGEWTTPELMTLVEIVSLVVH